LVGSVPGILSEANGPTHQALEDVALMREIPGMDIFCPADREDLLLGLDFVLRSARPCYVRLNTLEPVITHQPITQWGRAELVLDGSDVVILTYGPLFREALEAARILENSGLSVWLVNMRTLEPLDEAAILETCDRAQLIVTVEDHFRRGGLYTMVAETLL